MITHLDIKNFAIIKDLSIDLKNGLNILTGETGAGKSIIIEAVSMALGSRADTDYIRTGEDKAEVTLVVDGEDVKADDIFEELGLEYESPMVLHREISSQSKSVCRINGSIVPLSALNKLCKRVADIHGQYDHQSLLNQENHLGILDMYAGEDLKAAKEDLKSHYDDYILASTELMNIRKSVNESERQKDLLRFEAQEIEAANISLGEDETLEEEIKLMENSEKIYEAISEAHNMLYSDGAAANTLGSAMKSLDSVSGFSKELDDALSVISDAYYQIEDLSSSLRHIQESISYSQEELNEKIERLELLNGLKRKFGGSLEKVLEYFETAQEKLTNIENADERIAELEKLITIAREKYDEKAAIVTDLRKKCADVLKREITRELAELNFKNAEFSVEFENAPISAVGADRVEFMISANKGEALRPLTKVASGGELSRVMLALKRILSDSDSIPTMIFDEIDTGISGATAGIVGEKLKSISDGHQIICITHLPQIAALGDYHYKIEKTSDEYSTSTTIVPLNTEDRIEELARLLSGTNITDAARMQAKELLNGQH